MWAGEGCGVVEEDVRGAVDALGAAGFDVHLVRAEALLTGNGVLALSL